MASDLYHPYLLGGGERRMYEIAKRLARKHDVHIITRKIGASPANEIIEGVTVHRVPVPSGCAKLESPSDGLAFMGGCFLNGLKLGDFDVYFPQQFFPIPPLWMVSRIRGKPIIVTIHDVYRETWIQKYGLKGSLMAVFEKAMIRAPYNKIITVSQSSKKKLVQNGVREESIVVIPNGVELKKFQETRVGKSTVPRVIYVGRLVGYKHVDDLLVAFSRVKKEAELYIVGEGPEKNNLRKLASKLGIEKRVFFTGFIDDLEKIKLLKSSWVLVLPSSTEGFGIAVIEAWAAGTPVLVSNIPALSELVERGGGLKFKLRDIDELSQKLELVLTDDRCRKRMASEGLRLVREYDWDEVARRHEELLLAYA